MLQWAQGNPSAGGAVYYMTAGPWTMAKVYMQGEPRYELWRGWKRYPESGTYASFAEADKVANLLDFIGFDEDTDT